MNFILRREYFETTNFETSIAIIGSIRLALNSTTKKLLNESRISEENMKEKTHFQL